jgi:hypothetical protein
MEGKLAHREILNTLPPPKWFLPLFRAKMWIACSQKKRKTKKRGGGIGAERSIIPQSSATQKMPARSTQVLIE